MEHKGRLTNFDQRGLRMDNKGRCKKCGTFSDYLPHHKCETPKPSAALAGWKAGGVNKMKWNDPNTYWDGKTIVLMLGVWVCLTALVQLNIWMWK